MVSFKHLLAFGLISGAAAKPTKPSSKPAASVSCNGKSYTYEALAGFGSLKSDARDQYGDTISIGSAMAVKGWKKVGKRYRGTMFGLPDRGFNTQGTQNTIPRVHIFDITFTPAPDASLARPSGPNLEFTYVRTILLSGPDGKPMTGLDPDFTGGLAYPGFPSMPVATYPGDGFGGPGPGDKRLVLDAEGLVVEDDGSFWISDEYGPFVFKFNPRGKMVAAIRPPDALIPIRGNQTSFNSNTAPIYDRERIPKPADPDHGRQNNQGFEGLTISPDGKTLWVMLQSAARQEGGASSSKRRMTRFLKYGLKKKRGGEVDTVYEAEYVVPLPTFLNADNATRVAAQSEIHYVSDTQFLVLARDSSTGRGQKDPLSGFRQVVVADISAATDIKGPRFDDVQNGNITAGGISSPSDALVPGITSAKVCPFIDFNINAELGRFKTANGDMIHNGAPVDLGLLNEKWEALALLPVNNDQGRDCDEKDEYYLIALSDNDFITNDGYANFGKVRFKDDTATVPFLDSQALVFKVTLPKGSKPLIG
ncbi:esterase-like activity of phytase-domain-containing protein [Podospora aff. communis PSN243]|uniref:Esterase-like activity of phytase-domain-containing protein n=1 Tax=Podospora aff. communis PSN243 TaxID=3040156 RepID=A0AAV9GKT9_9PEZI|nr:esterase-like activity of phytase-domain-containing protein [Podospora aff. communis PSN243]